MGIYGYSTFTFYLDFSFLTFIPSQKHMGKYGYWHLLQAVMVSLSNHSAAGPRTLSFNCSVCRSIRM